MQLRAYPLDGALLYFEGHSGVHVRLQGPAYAGNLRQAPRVVQLGLTNRCNLRCDFCFRDRDLESAWTAAEILEWAAVLDQQGVLELGFGQGEPLLFPDFPGLVRRLARETALTINFTTNGLRLDDARLDAFDRRHGQLRLSHYDDNDPLTRVRLLARRRERFGVNLLVTPARLPALRGTIEELLDAGCRDVLLLGYNGPDHALHLSPQQDRQLARIILELHARHGDALVLGLSLCFGRRLFEVPQLATGDDCGAGDDFLTIDSQKRMLACSFHGRATAVDSATAALDLWRANRALRSHAGLRGCARPLIPLGRARVSPQEPPGVLVWQAFASNHSASYTLVGEFSTALKSADYIAAIEDLLERCRVAPEDDRPAPETLWQALGRHGEAPHRAWQTSPQDFVSWRPDSIIAGGTRTLVHDDSTLRHFEIFAHQLLRRHGRILWSGDRPDHDMPMLFAVEADRIDALATRLEPLCEQSLIHDGRLYGLVQPYAIAQVTQLLQTKPLRALTCVHESEETLEALVAGPRMELPSRKRRVEWTLLDGVSLARWRGSLERLRADPAATLAEIDWHHPFRMPERLDAYALLGHTVVRSEGAPFPGALQAWFDCRRFQIVPYPTLRVRVARHTGSEDESRPFHGLRPAHVDALSRPGGSFVVVPYHAYVDIIPRNPAATFAQLEAILGGERGLTIDIMAEQPLADALARVDADLDRA